MKGELERLRHDWRQLFDQSAGRHARRHQVEASPAELVIYALFVLTIMTSGVLERVLECLVWLYNWFLLILIVDVILAIALMSRLWRWLNGQF